MNITYVEEANEIDYSEFYMHENRINLNLKK